MRRCSWMIFCSAALMLGCSSGEEEKEKEDDEPPVMEDAKLLIEHNATDGDTGFQAFADGDPWSELEISGPDGPIARVRPGGSLGDFGLTELFFETSEPENAVVSIEDVLARLPEGSYTFRGTMVGGGTSSREATFTHTIPAGPVIVTPVDASTDTDPDNTVIEWEPVTETYDGSSDIDIVGYQVTVEKLEEPPSFPQGFARTFFSVYLPADATSIQIPPEFMQADAIYECEVLAIEESGNQTLTSSEFLTGTATEMDEPPEMPVLTKAKLLIEHNSTDRDTGFQGFADGEPWNRLVIDPSDLLVQVDAEGSLVDFGLTELFFETHEPENAEVSIPDVLSRIPEGDYAFTGDIVGADASSLTADMTHTIPAGPRILLPEDGATGVDPDSLVVAWEPVDTTIDGSTDISIVGYEVIVEKDEEEPAFPQGFARPVLDVLLPDSATSLSVPSGFLEAGTAYKFEVLAIEVSGNQTLASGAFTTR